MDSKMISYTQEYVNEMKSALDLLPCNTDIETVINILLEAYKNDNMVFTFGNGGSGNLAAHLVQDLNKHTIVGDDKSQAITDKRFKAICLNENISSMTTWANDAGYNKVFSEQLVNFVGGGDVVIGITGSGNTENVIKALRAANYYGATSIAFTGGTGGKVKDIAQVCLKIESEVNYCIEDALSCVIHIICDYLKQEIKNGIDSK